MFASGRSGWRVPVALLAVLAVPAGVRAAPEGRGSVFDAAREAVARGRTEKTALAGFDVGPAPTADSPPEGGILVGFEVGLGEFLKKQTIYALRPLYLTPAGILPSQSFGPSQGSRGAGKKAVRSKVTRTVIVQARPGYAVGEVAIDSGLNIDAIAVTFMRIQGCALDSRESYTEDWVGTHQDKPPRVLRGGGQPIVGVFARQDDVRVMALGLVRMRAAEVAAPLPAPPEPPAIRPAPPRAPEAAPQAEPPVRPAHKAPPAAEEPAAPDPAAAVPAPAPAQGEDGFPWLILGVFVAVSASLFLGLTLVLRRTEPTRPAPLDPTEEGAKPPGPDGDDSTDVSDSPRARGVAEGPDEGGICARQAAGPHLPAPEPAEVAPAGRPPYFVARAVFNFRRNRLFRVYVLRDRLLFIDVEPEYDPSQLAWAVPVIVVGMLFGLIGGLFACYLFRNLKKRTPPHVLDLDGLDAEELIGRAAYSKGCFAATRRQLSEVRLEAPTMAHTMWWAGLRCAGLLHLRHRKHGPYTLQVLEQDGMQVAVELLPQLLGRRVEVNVVFSRSQWRYVRRD
jgi:hypothetical protein